MSLFCATCKKNKRTDSSHSHENVDSGTLPIGSDASGKLPVYELSCDEHDISLPITYENYTQRRSLNVKEFKENHADLTENTDAEIKIHPVYAMLARDSNHPDIAYVSKIVNKGYADAIVYCNNGRKIKIVKPKGFLHKKYPVYLVKCNDDGKGKTRFDKSQDIHLYKNFTRKWERIQRSQRKYAAYAKIKRNQNNEIGKISKVNAFFPNAIITCKDGKQIKRNKTAKKRSHKETNEEETSHKETNQEEEEEEEEKEYEKRPTFDPLIFNGGFKMHKSKRNRTKRVGKRRK